MKKAFLILFILMLGISGHGQTLNPEKTNSRLALNYYRAKEYDKAASLYKDLYEGSKLQHYFDYYINCLIELKDYDSAEKELKKKIRRQVSSSDYITLGHIYKLNEDIQEMENQYEKAIKTLPKSFGIVLNTASSFIKYREFNWAEKTYLKGVKMLPAEDFSYQLAIVYGYQRNYQKMLDAYLDMIEKNEENLKRVQGRLASALYLDVDDNLRDLFKRNTILRIQKNPEKTVFNHLLVWFFQQEKDYNNALRQLIAIDKRTGNEGNSIITLSKSLAQEESFELALKGLEYLLGKKTLPTNIYNETLRERMNVYYAQFQQNIIHTPVEVDSLKLQFESTLADFKEDYSDPDLIKKYANFLSFYSFEPLKSIEKLESFMRSSKMSRGDYFDLRTELADAHVAAGNLWDATLEYAKIIEANKNNSLGDEVKLKKAKLGFYMGNFDWAKAQLDALKASTSKLIANDAMELSLLIANNYDLDTTEVAMKMFARAELYVFKKDYEMAFQVYDSIESNFAYHSLLDDILYRKAMAYKKAGDFAQAESNLKEIIKDYNYELLADNAKYQLGILYQEYMNQPIEAAKLFKDILLNHTGSIYVIDSRKRFRKLESLLPKENPETDEKIDFFNETN